MEPLYKTPDLQQTTANEEVLKLLKEFASVVQMGELERILSYYTSDVVAFDMMPPLEISGIEEYRKAWSECFTEVFEFPVVFELKPRRIIVRGDCAVVIGFAHVKGRFVKGGDVDSWLRGTTVLSKAGGSWKIAHEHNSVPLGQDMKGLMELRPKDESH